MSFMLYWPCQVAAADQAAAALADLKSFQLDKLDGEVPPCPAHSCHLIWAATAMALGDAGEYARRLNIPGMADYAAGKGIKQNFDAVRQFEPLPRVHPRKIAERFQLPMTNWGQQPRQASHGPQLVGAELRPTVAMLINGINLDFIVDTAGTLTIPPDGPVRQTLTPLPVEASGATALVKSARVDLSTVKELRLGPAKIHNMLAGLNKNTLSLDPARPLGAFGLDVLLHFRSVTMDLKKGQLLFNSAELGPNCVQMELELDELHLVSVIVVPIVVDGQVLRAMIDTGANYSLMIYGDATLPTTKLESGGNLRLIDRSGNLAAPKQAQVKLNLGTLTSTSHAFVIPFMMGNYSASLGAQFFAGRNVQFNFQERLLCVD
ncbi:MAG: hypothetical protein V4723_07390 [Pseudomonadota bacterium]